jgi:uncharacterized DUF497 family protein
MLGPSPGALFPRRPHPRNCAPVVTSVVTRFRILADGFEWDERKREGNLRSHKVDFIDVLSLFDGTTLEIVDDRFDYGETKIRSLGEVDGRVYVVVYTWRGGNRRIISARKANARERRTYYARQR